MACKNYERRCPKQKNVHIQSRKQVAPPFDVKENLNLEMVPISAETRLEAIHECLLPKKWCLDLSRDNTPIHEIDTTMNETAGTSPHTPTAGPSSYSAIPDEDEQVASPPLIPVILEGCPKHNIILPKHLHDLLLSKPTGFRLFALLEQKLAAPLSPEQCLPSKSPSPLPSPEPKPKYLETTPNDMGLYQRYREWPNIDSTTRVGLDEVFDAPTFTSHVERLANKSTKSSNPFYPFINITIFWLFSWFYQSTSKSLSDVTSLEIKVLDAIGEQQNLPFSSSDGWHETSMTIKLLQTGVEHTSEESAPDFEVTGVYHQNLLDVIISACQSTSFLDFHLKGFTEMWDPGNDKAPE
ncbi:uncharacterized protein ARMOST_06248 [Armillaria ostoyae]|uniref:Uncharacterized protein n=1 Tax=Armillaria ostoyae TaxID=47428 RepID=A0A284R2G1_ARMOS|nr:uncharacterized protein ARMOST_06248 [Armillaria ostoyae]